jgi:hypothetical protein
VLELGNAMCNQRLFWLGAGMLVVLGVGGILIIEKQRSGITRSNFEKIQLGMNETEVGNILGGPAGDYTDRPIFVFMHGVMFRRWWIGDEGVVTIELDLGHEPPEVAKKEFDPIPPESPLQWFQRKLSLPW